MILFNICICTSAFAINQHIKSVTLDGTNSGNIVSIGGGSVSSTAFSSLFTIKGNVGSADHTETNVNAILIGSGVDISGDVSLKGVNSGNVTNVGSKVNVNTIQIGY